MAASIALAYDGGLNSLDARDILHLQLRNALLPLRPAMPSNAQVSHIGREPQNCAALSPRAAAAADRRRRVAGRSDTEMCHGARHQECLRCASVCGRGKGAFCGRGMGRLLHRWVRSRAEAGLVESPRMTFRSGRRNRRIRVEWTNARSVARRRRWHGPVPRGRVGPDPGARARLATDNAQRLFASVRMAARSLPFLPGMRQRRGMVTRRAKIHSRAVGLRHPRQGQKTRACTYSRLLRRRAGTRISSAAVIGRASPTDTAKSTSAVSATCRSTVTLDGHNTSMIIPTGPPRGFLLQLHPRVGSVPRPPTARTRR